MATKKIRFKALRAAVDEINSILDDCDASGQDTASPDIERADSPVGDDPPDFEGKPANPQRANDAASRDGGRSLLKQFPDYGRLR